LPQSQPLIYSEAARRNSGTIAGRPTARGELSRALPRPNRARLQEPAMTDLALVPPPVPPPLPRTVPPPPQQAMVPPPVPPPIPLQLAASACFTGRMRAFRRIIVRGALLQVVTFGIYRFWLTTDARRFLWANTEIGGDSLEYAGTAMELFLGFLMAIALLVPI